MNDNEIAILQDAVDRGRVLWMPDKHTARRVLQVARHVEEGGDSLCAIFDGGEYVALYNSDLRDFCIVTGLRDDEPGPEDLDPDYWRAVLQKAKS